MDTTVFCNIGSIIVGLAGWLVPIIGVNVNRRKSHTLSVISFSCCAIALVMQLVEIRHRVMIGDISAVMDTISAILGAEVVLVLVTIFINILVLKFAEAKN